MFPVKLPFSLLSLNVRGIQNKVKRKAMFLFCKGTGSHCIFLQETHSIVADATFWSSQWGDKVLLSHGSSHSAGTAILFNNCPGKVISVKTDSNGHWVAIVMDIESVFFILINIYGYNNVKQNQQLFADVSCLVCDFKKLFPTDNIVIGGDFNVTPDETLDRHPPKSSTPQLNSLITNFCNNLKLLDVWRHLNPNTKQFSWFRPNASSKSRIDYWLISDNLLHFVKHCTISPAPLTDHCAIALDVTPTSKISHCKGYWKFNSDLLVNEGFCAKLKDLIREIENSNDFSSHKARWEFLKFRICEFSINYSKMLAKIRKQTEHKIVSEINKYCSKISLNSLEKSNFISLQSQLDDLYIKKAKGAYIRSRAKWIEEGEKSTSYFCRLEKRRQSKNSIVSLIVNDVEITDPKIISKKIHDFYSDLYLSNFSPNECDDFFEKIINYIPKINNELRDLCDAQLCMEELDLAVQKLKPNKSPGPDGLTGNFYKFFWNELKMLLFNALSESIEDGSLGPTMSQGLITLIPKPDKDHRILDNLRPITLLNSDYKIFTHVFVNRLKKGLNGVVNEVQSGFLKERSIHNNIRLVMDVVEYNHLIEDDGYILFLDFKKAFDTLEHRFLFKALESFGFGEHFVNIIKMIYKGMNSSISLPYGTSQRLPSIPSFIHFGCGYVVYFSYS